MYVNVKSMHDFVQPILNYVASYLDIGIRDFEISKKYIH